MIELILILTAKVTDGILVLPAKANFYQHLAKKRALFRALIVAYNTSHINRLDIVNKSSFLCRIPFISVGFKIQQFLKHFNINIYV